MPFPIVLATANARYSHTAYGLRCLHASLGPLRDKAVISEFTIRDAPDKIADSLLDHSPAVVGLGVYIWNVSLLTEVARLIKSARPQVCLVVGGPEVSYEYENTPLFDLCDHLVRGEGESAFAQLAANVLTGAPRLPKVIEHDPEDLAALPSPYDEYTDEDLQRRLVYVESSRGCPFRCEFCLSSLDAKVREFALEGFLNEMEKLLSRGLRQFKFVDRTFNLRQARVDEVLNFFLQRDPQRLRLHFEIVPDRLSPRTLDLIAAFPPGALHLEAGIQSTHPPALEAISRVQNVPRALANLRDLRKNSGALLHVDLVAGLPGETWESFARGFDAVLATRPHALQVGILKRLKGAPIARHQRPRQMLFNPQPPYDVIHTDLIDREQMARIKRFARYFDIYFNSSNFPGSMAFLVQQASPFAAFMALSDYVWANTQKTHGLALADNAETLYRFLVSQGFAQEACANAVRADFYGIPGRKEQLDLG